jgi:hypothetical protein
MKVVTYFTHRALRREGILKLDESCISNISNPKSEVSNCTLHCADLYQEGRDLRQSNLRFRISGLRCRIRPISKSPRLLGPCPRHVL